MAGVMTVSRVNAVSIHAPARGATALGIPSICLFLSFNPRAREGRDVQCSGKFSVGGVSIHAPARGATAPPFLCCFATGVSIHAPARGATARLSVIFRR